MGKQNGSTAYGWRMVVENDNTVSMIFSNLSSNQSYNSNYETVLSDYVFVVYTHNHTTGNFYFDGDVDTNANFAWTMQGDTTEDEAGFMLGKTLLNSSAYLKGDLDEVRVFNVTLTPTQVTAYYDNAFDTQVSYTGVNTDVQSAYNDTLGTLVDFSSWLPIVSILAIAGIIIFMIVNSFPKMQ
jgi:hypothetical protein